MNPEMKAEMNPHSSDHGYEHVIESLNDLYEKHRHCDEGMLATYIPELSKADPSWLGIALADVDGRVLEFGNSRIEFTIQSVSKPFIFGAALDFLGRDEVLKRVGVEPSGDSFNGIEFQKGQRPYNAMINPGAILATSLIPGSTADEKLSHILEILSKAAGRQLTIDEATYRSESETGHRNRAIGHLLRSLDLLEQDIDEILEAYFRQCSVLVNTHDLAVMGETLANMGTNPITGESVFGIDTVRDVLSVMFSCGMYDYAGEWAFRVGIPAKSGVSGGLIAVVNRQFGLGIFSPRLDPMGNTVRGVRVCTDFAEQNGLHAFNFTNVGSRFVESTWARRGN